MNEKEIQQRIAAIKQSIKDKTGKPVEVYESDLVIGFGYTSEQGSDVQMFPKRFLELLPLSLPNKEGWIAVDFIKDKINKLYRSIENMRKYSDFDPGAGNGIEKAEAQIEFCKSLIKEYENQPLPPAPVKKSAPSKFDEIDNGKNLPHF